VYEYLDEQVEEEESLSCLRGYPFMCPFALPFEIEDIDDQGFLYTLDAICTICQKRLEYERSHVSFAV
jgi:hypothetical protein